MVKHKLTNIRRKQTTTKDFYQNVNEIAGLMAYEISRDFPLKDVEIENITLVGLCTDICVISNALALKTAFPEVDVRVIESLCAGVTKESHDAAILTMKMCQVDII